MNKLSLSGFLILYACASQRPLQPSPSAAIKFFVLDPTHDPVLLRAADPAHDQLATAACQARGPLTHGRDLCYVTPGESYRALRKYIVEVEEDLRACLTRE